MRTNGSHGLASVLAALSLILPGIAGSDGVKPPSGGPAPSLDHPPTGPFGLSLVSTEDGGPLEVEAFESDTYCGECHERQWKEIQGSMHSVAHTDPLYRAAAELAREEAGEAVYAYCSGCHSPQGVSTGLIPGVRDPELPAIAKAGILCDVCHQVSALSGPKGPWGEPGNASFVLSPDEDRKFGPPTGDDDAAMHAVETREFLSTSEFCASCHTVIHPLNGVRIEHTYDEWKNSIFAEKGIQCQDCHMRSVSDALQVARTLEPVTVMGRSFLDGDEREISPHFFAGGNVNAERLGGSAMHAAMAEERLRGAAELELALPRDVTPGESFDLDVTVRNVAAGHSLPTSLTELREMWVELRVVDDGGRVLFESGVLDADGRIPPEAMRFGARAGDAQGRLTYKPWEITQFLSKRLIAAKGAETDTFRVDLPAEGTGPLRVEATLFYRSAPPEVVALLMGDEAIDVRRVEMARARAVVVRRPAP